MRFFVKQLFFSFSTKTNFSFRGNSPARFIRPSLYLHFSGFNFFSVFRFFFFLSRFLAWRCFSVSLRVSVPNERFSVSVFLLRDERPRKWGGVSSHVCQMRLVLRPNDELHIFLKPFFERKRALAQFVGH